MRNRTALVIAVLVVVALAVMWTSGAVLAQRGGRAPGGPGGPGGPQGMQPPMGPQIGMLKAGANGVFVLAGPTLIKYNAALEQQGTVQLVEPPTDTSQAPGPPLHGAMLIVTANGGEKALVLIGDKFFAVDTATLEISAQGTLPGLEAPEVGGAQRPMGPPPGPGGLEYRDGKLYVQRGPTIVALSVADGSVVGQATLPKPEAP